MTGAHKPDSSSPGDPQGIVGVDRQVRLFACPLCGGDKGYTLRNGSTYRWWIVSCAACGEDIGECAAHRQKAYHAPFPERWGHADEHWNAVGAYAERLRVALRLVKYQAVSLSDAQVIALERRVNECTRRTTWE
jgi:predicted RNA-binding Zn-ribbon protein involved in translation (DUF1610 family)